MAEKYVEVSGRCENCAHAIIGIKIHGVFRVSEDEIDKIESRGCLQCKIYKHTWTKKLSKKCDYFISKKIEGKIVNAIISIAPRSKNE